MSNQKKVTKMELVKAMHKGWFKGTLEGAAIGYGTCWLMLGALFVADKLAGKKKSKK